MAQVVWAEPALQGLDAIADYIALENPDAAKLLVRKLLETVEQLEEFPESGTRPRELRGAPYRKLTIKPVLVYYRIQVEEIYIVHVVRNERKFSLKRIQSHDK